MNQQSLLNTPYRVVNASAGSGKTTQLVQRLLSILNRAVEPNRICATTFTRKAAYEINSRLYRTIADAALGKKSGELSQDTATSLLNSMTVGSTQPKIVTIDSFFSEAARYFALELGLPPEWSIVPESESRELLSKLSDELMQSGDRKKMGTLVRLLKNDRAVRSFHQSLISEITKGISLWREVRPEERIDVWKWREIGLAKGREVEEIIADLSSAELPRTADGKKINANFHKAVSALVLVLQQKDARSALKNGLIKALVSGTNTYYGKEFPDPLFEIIKESLQAIESDLAEQLHFKALALFELMSDFNESYLSRVRDLGLLSYDDLKLILGTGLSTDWSELLSIRLDSKFDHLLFDEFQDTSLLQWKYFKDFVEEILSSGLSDKSLFIVGDKKQSIYGWRGGVKKLFDHVSENIESAGGSIESVSTNYRSCPEVIALVNKVYENLFDSELALGYRTAATDWLKDYQTHQAYNKNLAGEVKLIHASEAERVGLVVELARELVANPDIEEIGILVRTNKELRLLAKIFDAQSISVSQEGGAPLENEPLCIVLVNLLQLLDHPGDTVAALIVASSIVGELLLLSDHLDSVNVLETVKRVRTQIDESGLYEALSTLLYPLRLKLSPRELTVLDEVLEIALVKANRIGPRLASLVPIIRKHKFERASGGKIRLLTAHSAKGLEFDVVILSELTGSMLGRERDYLVDRPDELDSPKRVVRYENKEIRQLFPDLERISQAQKSRSFEESLSVLYVSLTRAKRGLALFFGTSEKNEDKDSYQTLLGQIIRSEVSGSQTLFGNPGTIFPFGR